MSHVSTRKTDEPDFNDDFARLRMIVEQSPSAVVITDSKGIIEYGNNRFFVLSGYRFDEVKGKNVSMLNSSHEPPGFYENMWRDLLKGVDWKGEFRNKKKNGDAYWVLASISPYFNRKREISHFIGILEDITYLKQIEFELKQSEEKFRVLFETLPEGIIVTDMEGFIIQINQACLKIFRHNDKNRLLGKNIKEIVSGDSMEVLGKLFLQAERNGYSKLSDYRLPYDDPLYVDVQVSLMKGNLDEDIGFVILIGDITENKIAEKALRESEARNRALIEAVPDIMFRVNDEGLYLDKMLGTKINEVFPQEVAEKTVKYISDAIKTREIQIFEYPVISGGKEEYYEARFVAIEDDEVLVILRNVTERRNAMEAIEEARREAEVANRSKGEFLANMSHEIRTPLNSITGFIELLMRTGIDDTQRDYLDIIRKSASGLLGIINDILDFSKIESNRLEINNVEFNPYVEFESVVSLFNIKAREKGIVFLSFIDPRLPSGIISDPMRIKQILSNLLSNAIKFTPENGFVRVDISLIHKDSSTCLLYFMVSDTGIGIPPRKQRYIFEAFAQADSSITRRFGGTGLGLSISSNLARLLDSEIIIESEAGVGSRFFFSLEPEISEVLSYNEKFQCDENASIYLYSDDSLSEMVAGNIESYLAGFGCNYSKGSRIDEFKNKYDLVIAVYTENLHNCLRQNPETVFKNRTFLVLSSVDEEAAGEIIKYFSGTLLHPLSPEEIIKIIPEKPGTGRHDSRKVGKDYARSSKRFYGEVLVGEDDKTNQKLIRLLLSDYGIKADIAGNGLDVFDMFRGKKYDLILMDMHMPVADGLETTRMIIDYEDKKGLVHTPVVALTAKVVEDEKSIILNSGLDGYLTKPMEIEKLESVLDRYLAKSGGAGINAAEEISGFSGKNIIYSTKSAAEELKIPENVLINIAMEFLNDAMAEVNSLRKAAEALSFDEIYLHSHKLKGASVNLRFEKLGGFFYEMEENAASNNKEFDYCRVIDIIERELAVMKKIIFSGS